MQYHSHPPMFTSHGYQPSIFMDSTPVCSCLDRHPQDYAQQMSYSQEDNIPAPRVDFIQIWLNAHPLEQGAHETVPATETDVDHSAALATAPVTVFLDCEVDIRAQSHVSESSQGDPTEWVSCLSSPSLVPYPVPELDPQSPLLSQDPHEQMQQRQHPNDAPCTTSSMPISLAFQQRAMLPRLPFRGRARCIFLAPESTAPDNRMHRRVKELLHNTAVQRIRTWFKNTVEPCALEQWRNLSLLNRMSIQTGVMAVSSSYDTDMGVSNMSTSYRGEDCPICFKRGSIMKVTTGCGHAICWKCEQSLERTGNISCPMCRRLRLTTTYRCLLDMYKTTIGLHPSDYKHPLCKEPASENSEDPDRVPRLVDTAPAGDEDDNFDEIEHELSDRYIWEPNASFLEHLLCPTARPYQRHRHSVKQYFQLNAAQDLCFKPATDQHLPEYNDQEVLEPPSSGLVLPPHRLYIALIHFCLDMLTLPNPSDFQNRPEFKREVMLIELVTLFLVPTDEFSPRNPSRVYNAPAWIEHGQYILARIHRFLQTKIWQSAREVFVAMDPPFGALDPAVARADVMTAVPSTPIARRILYMGTARWTWVAQSLSVLIAWIQAAHSNPSMIAPTLKWTEPSTLGKRGPQDDEEWRPAKIRLVD